MPKKISVFTGTRAEYGLLYWLINDIQSHPDLDLQLIVSGSHLSPEFGQTISFIKNDGFSIDAEVEMLLSSDSAVGTCKSLGLCIIGYADALHRLQPDCVIVLGDRYEALAFAQTSFILRIPIIHLHGGEKTEGAYDDSIRHALTKFSTFHFVSNLEHQTRVVQLGESPETVFNVGAIGLDNINRLPLLNLQELQKSLNFNLGEKFFLVTYHPVTLGFSDAQQCFQNLINALNSFPEYKIIITYPNADDGGRALIPLIEKYKKKNPTRIFCTATLGQIRYLSALKLATVVIGNSSSGIIEAPSAGTPTVNIGIRQSGRLQAKSVFNCDENITSIIEAIQKAIQLKSSSNPFPENPYFQKDVTRQIIDFLVNTPIEPQLKIFHDLKQNQ